MSDYERLLAVVKPRKSNQNKRIRGIGVNDATYPISIRAGNKIYVCPYYQKWVAMFTRCYSKDWLRRHPTYSGVYVCKEWHSFMAFKSWMEQQDWKGKQLDKDLLSLGKGVYSPSTCLFVTRHVNSIFTAKTSELPIGIYKRFDKYEVGVSTGKSKRKFVGHYPTLNEAIDAFIKAKSRVVEDVARKQPKRTKDAILGYLQYYTDTLNKCKTVP